MWRTQSSMTQDVPGRRQYGNTFIIFMFLPNIWFGLLVQLGCWGDRHLNWTYSAFSSVPFLLSCITAPFVLLKPPLFPDIWHTVKALLWLIFHTVTLVSLTPELALHLATINFTLQAQCYSLHPLLSCLCWRLGQEHPSWFLLVFSLLCLILLPSACLWLGSLCSVPSFCLYVVVH